MAVSSWSAPRQNRRRATNGKVFCVGWKAYINGAAKGAVLVPSFDRDGNSVDNDLLDGQEVEILSWQPGSSLGLLYEIRRHSDGVEYWIASGSLREASGASKPEPAS